MFRHELLGIILVIIVELLLFLVLFIFSNHHHSKAVQQTTHDARNVKLSGGLQLNTVTEDDAEHCSRIRIGKRRGRPHRERVQEKDFSSPKEGS